MDPGCAWAYDGLVGHRPAAATDTVNGWATGADQGLIGNNCKETVANRSHFAQVSFRAGLPGREHGAIRWWNGSAGFGAVVLKGTMVQSRFERRGRGEITTTSRRLEPGIEVSDQHHSGMGHLPLQQLRQPGFPLAFAARQGSAKREAGSPR